MAWKSVNNRTSQQQQAKAAATAEPVVQVGAQPQSPEQPLTNDDIERMIDAIPEAQAVAQQTHAEVQRVEDMANAVEAVVKASPSPLPSPLPVFTDDEINALLANITPQQAAKARTKLGIRSGGGLRRLPDGGVEVMIRISVDAIPPLESWAESAGKSLEDQIQEIAEQSITNYCFQDWSQWQTPAPAPTPVAAAAPAGTTPPAAVPGK
jgi:hypothetical protein